MRGLVLFALLLGACAAPDARRAGVCGDRATVQQALAAAGETPEGAGLNRQLAETTALYVGPSSWTVVQANRFGAQCILAAGDEWRGR